MEVTGTSTDAAAHTETTAKQTMADWFRLFSDERFRRLDALEYADHNFIREHCRLGFDRFVHNSVDEALLQLYSKAANSASIAVIGAPFTPCHWGTLAVLVHLFRAGNYDLNTPRTVYWLTTERHERALFARLRMHGHFRRVSEALASYSSLEDYDAKVSGTSLVFLKGTHEIRSVPEGQSVVVSDARGELVYRKGEANELVRMLSATGSKATLIIPSRSLTLTLEPAAICWPWSDAAFANARIPERFDAQTLPWKWELGAGFAGKTDRRILTIDGVKSIADLMVELKDLAYALFAKPKTFYDTRLTIEFQRIIGAFRQIAIPLNVHESGEDPRRLSARLERLEQDALGASPDVADELQIGLLYARDLVRHLQQAPAKWDLLRRCIEECIESRRDLALAFPQKDDYSCERTVVFVREYAATRGADLTPRVIRDPDDLPYFTGDAVLLGVPKLGHASRWRIPFAGRLTILAWTFDQILANIAMRESTPSAEFVRQRTWTRHFSTPLHAAQPITFDDKRVDEEADSSISDDYDGSIEAFDPSYRGMPQKGAAALSDAIIAKAGYVLHLDDGTTLLALASEEHHVVHSAYGSKVVKMTTTAELRQGDNIILINGESYDQLTKRLQVAADRFSSLLSFNELWDRWQFLCVLCDDTVFAREGFIRKLYDYGCERGRGTILSWLRLQRMGPEKYEDIALVALAAGDFELAHNAKNLWDGLNQRRSRHRKLGKWLKKALTHSAGTVHTQRDKVIDDNLGLTFGDLQRGISVKCITHVIPPVGDKYVDE